MQCVIQTICRKKNPPDFCRAVRFAAVLLLPAGRAVFRAEKYLGDPGGDGAGFTSFPF
jgi:hypothetical protein